MRNLYATLTDTPTWTAAARTAATALATTLGPLLADDHTQIVLTVHDIRHRLPQVTITCHQLTAHTIAITPATPHGDRLDPHIPGGWIPAPGHINPDTAAPILRTILIRTAHAT